MKFLICLFAVVAVANAGYLAGNNVYGNGLYSSGSYIANPVQYVNAAPSVQVVRSAVPAYHSAQVYHSAPAVQVVRAAAPVYHHSAPIVQSQIVSSPIVSAPVYRSSPIISSYGSPLVSSVPITHSYGLNYGPKYATNYAIGGAGINVVKGFLKTQ